MSERQQINGAINVGLETADSIMSMLLTTKQIDLIDIMDYLLGEYGTKDCEHSLNEAIDRRKFEQRKTPE